MKRALPAICAALVVSFGSLTYGAPVNQAGVVNALTLSNLAQVDPDDYEPKALDEVKEIWQKLFEAEYNEECNDDSKCVDLALIKEVTGPDTYSGANYDGKLFEFTADGAVALDLSKSAEDSWIIKHKTAAFAVHGTISTDLGAASVAGIAWAYDTDNGGSRLSELQLIGYFEGAAGLALQATPPNDPCNCRLLHQTLMNAAYQNYVDNMEAARLNYLADLGDCTVNHLITVPGQIIRPWRIIRRTRDYYNCVQAAKAAYAAAQAAAQAQYTAEVAAANAAYQNCIANCPSSTPGGGTPSN